MKHDPDSPGIGPDNEPLENQPRWRQDFPINVPQDNYVARRDFTRFMVLTSLAFVVGQVWIGLRNTVRRARGKPPRRRIAHIDDIAVGQSVVFGYPGDHDDCILVRPDEQSLVAYSQKCTHLACAVRPKVAEGELGCPCHQAAFDLHSGAVLYGPPRRPLPRVRLSVTGDVIYAEGVEERTS